jgi:hypothetical protein
MISGPSRFWLPLAGVTVVAIAAGAAALFFLHGLPLLRAVN